MFVEIVRLFIVLLSTAGGYTAGRGGTAFNGHGAIIGATLGACVGYVAGGVIGRLLQRVTGAVEERFEPAPAGRMLVGLVGAASAGVLAALLSAPVVVLLHLWGLPVGGLLTWMGIYLGYRLAAGRFEELLALAGLSTRPLARATPYGSEVEAYLVDTSALIDGRLLAVARAGFVRGPLLVARFVLDELQTIADAQDVGKRRRGRRGLDLLEALQRQDGIEVSVVDDDMVEHDDVDAKLIALAKRLKVGLITVDNPLQRIAELQGIRTLNLHRLADGLRPVHVPGEVIRLPITREGKEPGQGVGFLDDGTMVVVGDAAELVGREVDVRITGNVKTSLGNMLFASVSQV